MQIEDDCWTLIRIKGKWKMDKLLLNSVENVKRKWKMIDKLLFEINENLRQIKDECEPFVGS